MFHNNPRPTAIDKMTVFFDGCRIGVSSHGGPLSMNISVKEQGPHELRFVVNYVGCPHEHQWIKQIVV